MIKKWEAWKKRFDEELKETEIYKELIGVEMFLDDLLEKKYSYSEAEYCHSYFESKISNSKITLYTNRGLVCIEIDEKMKIKNYDIAFTGISFDIKAKQSEIYKTQLAKRIYKKFKKASKKILRKKNTLCSSILFHLVGIGDVKQLKKYLEKGYNPNSIRTSNRYYSGINEESILTFAIKKENKEIVETLMNFGAKLDANILNLGLKKKEWFKFLLEKGAKPLPSIAIELLKNRNMEFLEIIIPYGDLVNETFKEAVKWAERYENYDLLKPYFKNENKLNNENKEIAKKVRLYTLVS
jgi:hypothetical protein